MEDLAYRVLARDARPRVMHTPTKIHYNFNRVYLGQYRPNGGDSRVVEIAEAWRIPQLC